MLQGHCSTLEAAGGQEQPLADLPEAVVLLFLFPQVEAWESAQRRCTEMEWDRKHEFQPQKSIP